MLIPIAIAVLDELVVIVIFFVSCHSVSSSLSSSCSNRVVFIFFEREYILYVKIFYKFMLVSDCNILAAVFFSWDVFCNRIVDFASNYVCTVTLAGLFLFLGYSLSFSFHENAWKCIFIGWRIRYGNELLYVFC